MKLRIISFLVITLVASGLLAQGHFEKGSQYCWYKKSHSNFSPDYYLYSPNSPKHSYDVLNYKLFFDIRNCFISPYPKSYNAWVEITFRIDTALSSINLNATNSSLQVNSVALSGVSFTHTNNILTVQLNRTYQPGETTSVRVNYQHLNVSDGAFYASNGMVFTDCEPEGARKLYPCWDRPYDKATLDLTAKVPANVRLGSNGRLNDSLVTGDTIYYHWISIHNVATYLIVMSARVNYGLDIVYWHKISNPADSIPIRFYYNPGENPAGIKNIIGNMTSYYSAKFGEHAFEKNGFATLNNQFTWGGMENQTLTSLCPNCWSQNLVSHEFAHQWYGDLVTCGTWGDIWLNEGFATYIEAIWYEYTGGYTSYKNDIISDANSYFSGNTGNPIYRPEWINNTPPVNELFNYALTYAKGACVLHMLRYVVNDTAMFFNMLRSYAMDTAQFKYKDAVTDDFTAKIGQVYGSSLVWFIDEWVKQPNHPVYQNYYYFTTNSGSNWSVGFQARQIQTNTPFHRMPIVVRITFTSGPDTNIRVDNNVNYQIWYWNFNRTPSTVVFDPNNDIVLKTGTTVYQQFNAVSNNELPVKFAVYQNYPNPFNPLTRIDFELPKQSLVTIKVYDAAGKLVSTPLYDIRPLGRHTIEFDGRNLASGMYYYELTAGDFRDVKKMVLVK
jgi:aminopeptidase N